jgi:hypothetical protein
MRVIFIMFMKKRKEVSKIEYRFYDINTYPRAYFIVSFGDC